MNGPQLNLRNGRAAKLELKAELKHTRMNDARRIANQIDALDRQLVELLSERARAAQMIGHLKAATRCRCMSRRAKR
jgi:chorismate mutase